MNNKKIEKGGIIIQKETKENKIQFIREQKKGYKNPKNLFETVDM